MSIYHKTWQLRYPARWFTCEFLGRIWCSPSPIDQIVTGHAKPGKSLSGWPENLKKIQTHLAFSMCKGTPWAYLIPKVGILILILGLEFSIIDNRTKMFESSPHGEIVKDNIYNSICDELGFLTQNVFPIFVKTQPRPWCFWSGTHSAFHIVSTRSDWKNA